MKLETTENESELLAEQLRQTEKDLTQLSETNFQKLNHLNLLLIMRRTNKMVISLFCSYPNTGAFISYPNTGAK